MLVSYHYPAVLMPWPLSSPCAAAADDAVTSAVLIHGAGLDIDTKTAMKHPLAACTASGTHASWSGTQQVQYTYSRGGEGQGPHVPHMPSQHNTYICVVHHHARGGARRVVRSAVRSALSCAQVRAMTRALYIYVGVVPLPCCPDAMALVLPLCCCC